MKIRIVFSFSLFFFSLINFAQTNNYVEFQSKTIELEDNIDSFDWSIFNNKDYYKGGVYAYVRFERIPTQNVQDELINNNIAIINYINHNTYLFYFSRQVPVDYLINIGIKSIIKIDSETKIALDLIDRPFGDWAIKNDEILINLEYYKNIKSTEVINRLEKLGVTIIKTNEFFPVIEVAINENNIANIASQVFVKYMEQKAPPAIPDDTRGKSLHRVNAINTKYASGRHLTGDGIGVMVRDDGGVGPHVDFKGRIDNSWTSGYGGNHGDGVAGIMCGAGNIDPYMEGMAPEASLFVVDYESDFLDTATNTLINDGSVQITNSSYSNGCNTGYTSSTNTVDTQSNLNPTLLHVFSAGNSNGDDCDYGAGDQWGNITGGHKQGKNVIATANVFYDGAIVNSSSRGPAYDGRIKPDIAANGQYQMSTDDNNTYRSFGGTSGAAPNIVGIAADCYQIYNQLYISLPKAALIKATLLNTANDLGNLGPDFKFGWGHVNALRAVKLIEDHRFFNDIISQGEINQHSISIPSGTREVRFMLYWNDPAANAGASSALINDIDLSVDTPTGELFLPWVLDATPDKTLLDLPATKGADHMNNMEQVLIKNPEAGNYTLNINGFGIPVGPQEYFIVYEIITDTIDLTYPLGGESFTPSDTEIIHWDTNDDSIDVQIDYTIDNGVSWLNIATVPSSDRLYEWTVPESISGQCKVRLTKDSFISESHEVFFIADEIKNVNLIQVCADHIVVSCNPLTDAVSYELYKLGDEKMELIGTSSNSTITGAITDPNEDLWYAIKAVGPDGWKTKRSIAKHHYGGLYNCEYNDDLSVISILNPSEGASCDGLNSIVSVFIANTGSNNQQNFNISYQINADPIVSEVYSTVLNSGETSVYEFTQSLTIDNGVNYSLLVWVELIGDENSTNDQKSINFINLEDIHTPWSDDVEMHQGTTLSDIENCWESSPSGVLTAFRWNIVDDGTSTPSPETGPNYAYSGTNYFYTEASAPAALGDEATLITPSIDISNLSIPTLSFFYYMYGEGIGSLHIDILNNGEWNLNAIVILGEQQAAGSLAWKEQQLVLNAYSGEIKIRFRGVRGINYKGDIAIDDISIKEAPSCPTPTNVVFTNASFDAIDVAWNPGYTESNWQLEYGEKGYNQGSGTLKQSTTNSYTIISLNSATQYDLYMRANCGGAPGNDDSGWIGPFTFETLNDYCNGDHFYDSGGISNEYTNNEDKITTINPTMANNAVRVTFNSFQTESCCDFLKIYNGPDISSPLIGIYSGNNAPEIITSTDPSGSLTFLFTSDLSITDSGWEARIDCVEGIGIDDNNIESLIFYPNPVSLDLRIKSNEIINNISVYTVLGQEVVKLINTNKKIVSIDFSKFSVGNYYIKVFTDNRIKTLRIIKK